MGYNEFAPIYNRYWTQAAPALFEKAFMRLGVFELPKDTKVLDLCCGTAQLAALLTEKYGYAVTGVDNSIEMLKIAGKNAPNALFQYADARSFRTPTRFKLALSCFDSINHFLTEDDVAAAFSSVRASLAKEGKFIFDVNDITVFSPLWEAGYSIVEEDSVCVVRPEFAGDTGLSVYRVTVFEKNNTTYKRRDTTVTERYYPEETLIKILRETGFKNVQILDGAKDLKIPAFKDRLFYVCN